MSVGRSVAEPLAAANPGQSDAAPVIEAMVADGHVLRIPVRGHCMHPALRQGDVAVFAPFLGLPRIGQIVLARAAGGPLVVRRLVDVTLRSGRRLYRLRGDAEERADAGVMREDLYGRLIEVEREGRRLSGDDAAFAPPDRVALTPAERARSAFPRRRR